MKSDDIVGRVKTYEAIVKGTNIPSPGVPESFKVLLKELQSLALDIRVMDAMKNEIIIRELEDDDTEEMAMPVRRTEQERTNEPFEQEDIEEPMDDEALEDIDFNLEDDDLDDFNMDLGDDLEIDLDGDDDQSSDDKPADDPHKD